MKKGFTLIELMIVMVIMGILAAIGVQSFISSQVKGRDTTRKGNLHAVSQALELYYNDKAQYPASDGNGNIIGCGGGVEIPSPTPPPSACASGTVWKDAKSTIYMSVIPKDPVQTQTYFYMASKSVGSSIFNQYQLYTHLENDSLNSHDSQIITPSPAAGSPNCGTGACNYGVSSSNITP